MFFLPSNLFPKLAFQSLKNGFARRASHRRSRLSTTHHTALYRIEQLEDRVLLAAAPTIQIDDVQQPEGDSGNSSFVFTVSRSGKTNQPSTIDYVTSPGTATQGIDYQATSGTLNFSAGEKNLTITVSVFGDGDIEDNETFFVDLTIVDNGKFGDSRGVGTIENDDTGPPTLSISDGTVAEPGSVETFVSAGSGGLNKPRRMTLGPDGDIYVANKAGGNVLRYQGTSGGFIGEFVSTGSGGLTSPDGLSFGPDGNLYVVNMDSEVLRFEGTSGSFMDTFIGADSGGLDSAGVLVFGPDGDLFVSNNNTDEVFQYDGTTGAFVSTFVTAGSGGLDLPRDMRFGPDGNLYVVSRVSEEVLRYNGNTGTFIDEFIPFGTGGLDDPWGLTFDSAGHLLVSIVQADQVLRFDAATGAFIDLLVSTASGGVKSPTGLLMGPTGDLLIASRGSDEIISYSAGVTVTLSTSSVQLITVDYNTADGTAVAGNDYTLASGTLTFAPGETVKKILLAARDDVAVEGDETFSVNLSNAGSTTISDDQGVVTIVDDDDVREILINDVTVTEGDDSPHSIGAFASARTPDTNFISLTFGPSGDLFVAVDNDPNGLHDDILQFDGVSGNLKGVFVETLASDPFHGTRDMIFKDGMLYVAQFLSNVVTRYDASTGDFVDVFVSAGAGGLDGPDGMAFGPDGNDDGFADLYVTSYNTNQVLRYRGPGPGVVSPEAFIDVFVLAGTGGLTRPFGLEFGPSGGDLYVASGGTNQVRRFDANSGAFVAAIGSAADGLSEPRDVTFGPDGNIYVTSGFTSKVVRYDGTTGALIDDFVPAGSGGLSNTRSLAFHNGDLYVTSIGNNDVLRFGTTPEAVFTVTISTPSGLPVTVDFSTADGTAKVVDGDYTAVTNGTVVFDPGVTTRTIIVQTLDDTEIESDETFTVTLSGALGATITDGTGQGTIHDDDTPPTLSIDDVTVTEGDESIRFIDAFITAGSGGLDAPLEMVTGPDGSLYISSRNNNQVLRYNATTGAFIDAFVTAGSGGLFAPRAFTFGTDGNLYVVSGGDINAQVLRYQGPGGVSPGAFIDAFVTDDPDTSTVDESGGLDNPYGLTFGSDGNLYVGGLFNDGVLRYDGATGAFIDVFVSTGSGGLNRPRELAFASDGNLYVVSSESDSILRYQGPGGVLPGEFIDAFVPTGSGGLDFPVSFTFGPDDDLYVSCSESCDGVLRYDGNTGAFISVFVSSGSGGLDNVAGPFFDSAGNLYVSSAFTDEILRYGAASQAVFTVSLSSPSAVPVTVNYNTADGTAKDGVGETEQDYTAVTNGIVVFDPGVTTRTIIVQTLDDTEIEDDETFTVTLSGEVGATISKGIGQGTIQDDDTPIQTFFSTDVPVSIPDQTTVTSTLTVSGPLRILDINVQLDISHTKDQDLDVFLISPNNTRVELFTDVDGGGNDFSGTTLDDEAATSITTGTAPFSGSFRPEGSLSDFDGEEAAGVWTLEITDDKRRNTGTLNSWSLTITKAPPVGVTATPTSGLSTTEAGGTASFTVVLDSPPTGTVFVHLVPSDTSEGRLQDANSDDQTLEFDEINWDIPQEVIVIGIDDLLDDGDILYMIDIDISSSDDPDYLLLDPVDVELINLDNDAPLHAAGGAAGDGTVAAASLTQATLRAVVDQAVVLWQAVGVDPSLTAKLNAVPVQVADLSGSLLGIASSSGGIWIDRDATGFGWSTNAWAVNPGRIDLLSVVSHELGHLVGFDHDVMSATLQTGLRELPTSRFPVAHRGGPKPPSSVSSSLFVLGTGSPLSIEELEAPAVDPALLLPNPVLLEEQPDDESLAKDSITNEEIASTDVGVDDLFAEFDESLSDDLLTV